MSDGGALVGGVELGGTNVVCAIGAGPDAIRAEARVPTTLPEETLARAVAFFASRAERVAAVGIAAFGPLDLAPHSARWGSIAATPKPGWSDTALAGPLRRALGVPVAIDTDVNAAALAEHRWGAGRGCDPVVYVTVGTGIGGGGVVGGRTLRGLVHPEMGHMRVPHDRDADPFPGACPFHGDCLEGLASGPAMRQRWGQPAEALSADHPAWPLEARYLALGLANIVCALSPRRIVVGGGVTRQPALLPLVREALVSVLAGYVQAPEILERVDAYVVPPSLGARSAVLGAIALAHDALAA